MLELIYLIGAMITAIIGFSIASYVLIYKEEIEGLMFTVLGIVGGLVWPLLIVGFAGAWIVNKIVNKYIK